MMQTSCSQTTKKRKQGRSDLVPPDVVAVEDVITARTMIRTKKKIVRAVHEEVDDVKRQRMANAKNVASEMIAADADGRVTTMSDHDVVASHAVRTTKKIDHVAELVRLRQNSKASQHGRMRSPCCL